MKNSCSQAKRAHLSSDSESDPVFLPDTYESARKLRMRSSCFNGQYEN